MPKRIPVAGARDRHAVELPQNLDALVIALEHGGLYVDLAGQVPGTVLIRPTVGGGESPNPTRLILCPMDGGRVAFGVIRAS
jgi:hypothetical protein